MSQAADAAKDAASKADSKTPSTKDLADKAKKSLPFGQMQVGDLAFSLPGSNVSKDDLPNGVRPGDAAGLPDGPTAKPPSFGNPKALDQVSLTVGSCVHISVSLLVSASVCTSVMSVLPVCCLPLCLCL